MEQRESHQSPKTENTGGATAGIASNSIHVSPDILSSPQLHALFDILTHHETYAEVESFKDPSTISTYGYPFARHDANGVPTYPTHSSAPLLAGLFRSVVLSFPGIRNLPSEFWHLRFQGILEKLAEAELSESYDKGSLGTRKILAAAASSIHESVSRGILGGIERGEKRNLNDKYDRSQAEDLVRAWEDGVHELLYGDLIDELFKCAAERKSLEEHSAGAQACADYAIIHIATLLHHVLVLSPEGPYLVKLLESVHRLLPYSMIKQTLRVGNAATMINGMMRLLLAKVGVGALSNWVGITQNADDGMNLLQRIIWLVLYWDSAEARKTVEKIEKTKGDSAPTKTQLAAVKGFMQKSREEHEKARHDSLHTTTSMVVEILRRSDPKLLQSLTEAQHTQLSLYYSTLLMIRDREEIPNVLCRQNPDLFTQAVKDFMSSFDRIIRSIHENIDLRDYISTAEDFLSDFISVSKGATKKPSASSSSSILGSWGGNFLKAEAAATPPTSHPSSVEDYVLLLQKNKHLLYNWLHDVASKCPDIAEDFRVWAHETIAVFRRNKRSEAPSTSTENQPKAAGALSSNLQHLFASLPASARETIIPAINDHAKYLSTLEDLSLSRMQRIIENLAASASALNSGAATPTSGRFGSSSGKSSPRIVPLGANVNRSYSGPGVFLSKWQGLMDSTLIGPAVPDGPVRKGKEVKEVKKKGGVGASAEGSWDLPKLGGVVDEEHGPEPPDVSGVVEALGKGFRDLVGDLLREDERFKVPRGGEGR
ncbi:PX-associated-domain-containing protein [Cladorrhinum samala]|uniref:PX-associated-domain-containing protein n=1 Tax=Cladorrhinum samala TaxID=585594 RepID=A0AAV9HPK7_9PEZI|nr:PX-associated-domain-containing protein [Cladorrhinum samala]